MRKFWRAFRWGAFLFALIVDSVLFYVFEPMPIKFAASGLASLIMFFVFFFLANLVRGKRRIRKFLEENEHKVYETGLHWVRLVTNIWNDKIARRCIGIPLILALVTTFFEIFWLISYLQAQSGSQGWALQPEIGEYALGFYIPLIVSLPFMIHHVADWSSHRYVITPHRVIIHSRIFGYRMHTILLARVVDAQQDYSFWQQILGYGDIVFRETAGANEVLECVWGPKKFAKIATRYSHAAIAATSTGTEHGDGE